MEYLKEGKTIPLTKDGILGAIKPIETRYNGYRFRSRTEARWAVLMDALEIKYEYEKEGYQLTPEMYYLPDFYYHIPNNCGPDYGQFLEIKGVNPDRKELKKIILLSMLTDTYSNLAIGPPWDFKRFVCMECGVNKWWKRDDDFMVKMYDYINKEEVPIFELFWQFFLDDRDRVSLIPYAIEKSKSARFEHGENG